MTTHHVADLDSNPTCGASLAGARGTTQLERVDCATCLLEVAIADPAEAPAPAGRRHRVALVACSSSKLATAAPARDLYRSDLFRKASAYAERTADLWFVLSAKWHLVDPGTILAPYDVKLGAGEAADVEEWAATTAGQLLAELEDRELELGDVELLVLAGADYRAVLDVLPAELRAGALIPLAGLGIGEQLAWLKSALEGDAPAPAEVEPALPLGRKLERDAEAHAAAVRTSSALEELEAHAEQLRKLEELTLERVVAARAAGASWSTVGAALGVTKQAAAKRFGALVEEAERAEIRRIREEFRAAR